MKQIPLTQGKFALVDDDVYEWASKYKWYTRRKKNTCYAERNTGTWPFRKIVRLHREIMNAEQGIQVDHINGNGLDCRRTNMRLASNAENQRNRGSQANNTSGYKGVVWDNAKRKWRARIRVDGTLVHLGYFSVPEDAARAYDVGARMYHGEFAKTNF